MFSLARYSQEGVSIRNKGSCIVRLLVGLTSHPDRAHLLILCCHGTWCLFIKSVDSYPDRDGSVAHTWVLARYPRVLKKPALSIIHHIEANDMTYSLKTLSLPGPYIILSYLPIVLELPGLSRDFK